MKKIVFFLFALLLIFSNINCSKVAPATSLEVTVLDLNTKKPIAGVAVELYIDYQSWLDSKNPTIKAQQTDANGVTTFSSVETTTYYIDAVKGNLDNYAATQTDISIGPLVANQTNKKTVYIW